MKLLILFVSLFLISCTLKEENEKVEFISPYEERFSAYSTELIAFATKHNLLIEKYYHDAPSWSFCFEHPKGGQSKLDLSINEQGEMKVSSVWWFDDYKQFSRSLRWGESENIESSETLGSILESRLASVLAWEYGEWTQVANDYENIWGRYTESEFKNMTPKWPKVIP